MNLNPTFRQGLADMIEDTVASWYEPTLEDYDTQLTNWYFKSNDAKPYHECLRRKKEVMQERDEEINLGKIFLERTIEAFEKYEPYYTVTEEELTRGIQRYLTRRSVFSRMGEGAILAYDAYNTNPEAEPAPPATNKED